MPGRRRDYSFLKPKKTPPDIRPSLNIGIAPTPDFTLMSLACLVEFLRLAADEVDFSRQIYCGWSLLSHNRSKIRASCGFQVSPTELFGDPRKFDYVVVHGGVLHSALGVPDQLYAYVRKAVDLGVPVIGSCSGQYVLAELGLLSGRRCAVHFVHEALVRRLFPDVIPVTDQPVVRDGPFITCPGGLAAINLAMMLVGDHCGKSRVFKSLHHFITNEGFGEMQTLVKDDEVAGLDALDQRVVRAIGLMRQKMYETTSVLELSKSVGISARELTRLFKRYLGTSPAAYWRDLRLKSAHWMIINTDRSMTQIAYECGFTDSSHLIRWFRLKYDATPAKLRKLRNEFGIR